MAFLFVANRAAAQGQNGPRLRDVEGILEVHYEDAVDGARLTHFLNTGTERIPLRFDRNPPRHLLTGSRVRARGIETAGVLALGSGTSVSNLQTMALASPDTFGAQSTLVILFHFLDLATQPTSVATAPGSTVVTRPWRQASS